MPKFTVEMIVSYPLVLEAQTMEEVFQIAENIAWEDWPDEDAEIVEYCAELVDESEEIQQDAPLKPAVKSTAKLTVIKGGQ